SELKIHVFTTRPDTIFGASFMVLAPEHELVPEITTPLQRNAVDAYRDATAKRSERDRLADVKSVSGVFTGAYALNPLKGSSIPVWISDYVLASYGTGAVMAVPCGDQRDYDFARHFDISIPNIFAGVDISEAAFSDKEHTIITNSGFLNGLNYKAAFRKAIEALEITGQGGAKINYRMRDAVFSRQRYWGEPFPIYYKNDIPYTIPESCLPLTLPEVEKYLPTETGEPPLGRAGVWAWDAENDKVVSNDLTDHKTVFPLELNTMPGWAGSSSYFNRYMDARNENEFFSREAVNYWKDVDLYIGGSEHATGHLLYARFWQHFLYDKERVPVKEFARKLINQGMILGESAFVYRIGCFSNGFKKFTDNAFYKEYKEFFASSIYVSRTIAELIEHGDANYLYEANKTLYLKIIRMLKQQLEEANARLSDDEPKYGEVPTILLVDKVRVDIHFLNASNELDIEGFRTWRPEFEDVILIGENNEIITGTESSFIVAREPEKMSKSKYNVLNPDHVCAQYGADTLRMYEMFLGPLDQAKPWNTAGINGVHSFLKKLWRLYHSGPEDAFYVSDAMPQPASLKTLHKTIKKVRDDIEDFSFNTSVSAFMICVNELTTQGCTQRGVLEPLAILISPYAPHIAEELWQQLGHADSIAYAPFPEPEERYLAESSKEYPVSFNGKLRFKITLPLDLSREAIEEAVMANENTQRQLQGRKPEKIIIVPGKIINIVV
ncbi:MAG: leucine--tRNA ligase, partial [Sinomicrobium sp.]|nr:leucine--tRNA ligase [Sinomicrobium sp.]